MLCVSEQIRDEQLNLGNKLIALLQSHKSTEKLLQGFELDEVRDDEPAVILFTSGSESAPKGVPLSQKNILSNISGAVDVLEFHSASTLYGFLPLSILLDLPSPPCFRCSVG